MEYRAYWDNAERDKLEKLLDQLGLSLFSGDFNGALEAELAGLFPGCAALALNSGTAALHSALAALGIRPGDEVLIPAVSYAATALAPLYLGAQPVFTDICRRHFTMDAASCQRMLSQRTRAVIFVNLFGSSGTFQQVADLARQRGMKLIQDCAQSLGTSRYGTLVGGQADAACFSFFETKTISVGEGGAVLLKDAVGLEIGRRLRHHGMDAVSGCRQVKLLGYNYKMSELQAAVALAQIGKLSHLVDLREKFGSVVRAELGAAVQLQQVPSAERTCWDKIGFLLEGPAVRKRALEMGGELGARVYLNRPLCDEPAFQGCRQDGRLDSAREFCERHLVIQASPVFAEADLLKASRGYGRLLREINPKAP